MPRAGAALTTTEEASKAAIEEHLKSVLNHLDVLDHFKRKPDWDRVHELLTLAMHAASRAKSARHIIDAAPRRPSPAYTPRAFHHV